MLSIGIKFAQAEEMVMSIDKEMMMKEGDMMMKEGKMMVDTGNGITTFNGGNSN